MNIILFTLIMSTINIENVTVAHSAQLSTCTALQETGLIDYSEYIDRDDPSNFKDGDLSQLKPIHFARGIRCPCSSVIWETKSALKQHIQSDKHKRWLRQITAEMSDPIRVRQDAEKEKRHLHELNQKADYRIRALDKQLRQARHEITDKMQSIEALTEELDTYKHAVDSLCTKLEESQSKLRKYKNGIKNIVRDVIEREWESSDDNVSDCEGEDGEVEDEDDL